MVLSVINWDEIHEIYEIPEEEDLRHNMHQNIRRRWDKYLEKIGRPKKFPWSDLTQREKDYFICRYIYDVMMKLYVTDATIQNRVKRNIKNYIANSPLGVDDIMEERNVSIENVFKEHKEAVYSETQRKGAYAELCRDIRAYNKIIPLPTFEAFERNQSLRAYDYAMAFYNSRVDLKDIAGVYMRIILQALEEKLGLKVDYYLIEECLSHQADFFTYLEEKNIEFDDFEEFPTKYDENMGISEEEYVERKKKYAEYLYYKKKLNDLKSFYKYEK